MSYLDGSYSSEQRERRRLAENYAGMTDGELQRLARSAESLTELAWDALEDEMDRRHMEFPDHECSDDAAPEPRQEMEVRELVTIRQFRDLPEALLAKGSLESAGIECFLADENLVRLDWFISNFIGGIKLNVRALDAENAKTLLDEPILEGLYVQGVGALRAAALSQVPVARCELPGVGPSYRLHERIPPRAHTRAAARLAVPCV